LVHKKQNNLPAALQWFEKLHVILQNSAQVIFHLADIQDQAGNLQVSLEWFNVLISVVPTDPGVLARLGSIFERHGDRAQAFHYYSEVCFRFSITNVLILNLTVKQQSFRYIPSDLDVISWLGGYYVECQVYEQAIQLFERATFIQPSQVKWHLMIASCYRRSGNYQVAFETYRRIHDKFPDNLECKFCCSFALIQRF
jgi:intraflagellar transport protein 88